jgi:hypothetical protein
MNNNLYMDIQKRLKEIEDRKIEILQEIANINKHYREKTSRLNSEYAKLDEEYYHLQLKLMSEKTKRTIRCEK